ncbi:NAC domain-containing protein 104-like [Ananas comosus]|uniref:NAC domain-containing protein 104-like n=1 Tax=Ananas comosus TaxID=4615 RepID=A0A6P5GQ60_ANACO|nr:NAC domain-containing protein 104-like [Ananas comosus]
MGGATINLPPGFRFFPSDEELVVHFLYRKAAHLPCQPDIIPTIDLRCNDPWDLNGKALQGGNQWYFFTRRTPNRATPNGYWSPIDTDEPITSCERVVGVKKTLIFYYGETPQGTKTYWIMHEYHLAEAGLSNTRSTTSCTNASRPVKKRGNQTTESNKWVLCRVYESNCGSQVSFCDDGSELSCLDEVFLSLDDLDEVTN